jgi:hypothetical protein
LAAIEVLKNSLQREFEYESSNYKINKHILNLISDMGFVISDFGPGQSVGLGKARGQRLVKKSINQMIVINFDYRRRILIGPEDMKNKLREESPEIYKQLRPPPFSEWLKKNNLLAPDFDLPEYDEEEVEKEYIDANKNPMEKISDHKDDVSTFEICVINKRNEGIFI